MHRESELQMNMHLAESIEVLPQCRLWLAYFDGDSDESISATTHDIAEAKFSTQDLHRWQQFRTAEKKRQFLNSRLAIRSVLEKEFGKAADNILFCSDSSGCPSLQSHENDHVAHISLSHSANAVAVVISEGSYPVGVDIEVHEPLRTEALRLVALHPHEQVWCDLAPGRESEAFATLWTIKESVWKTLRKMQDIPFSGISVAFDSGIPTPVISHYFSETPCFRTQLFVQNSVQIVPGTLCLSTGNSALRGCVAQRMTV
jgi:phosphopantetheinyl transferase